jgi:pimeloyl-ACP methyl ester carboxylesterase
MNALTVKLQAAVSTAADDAEFRQASIGLSFNIALRIGYDEDAPCFPLLDDRHSGRLQITADHGTWELLAQAGPPVGYHSFSAAARSPGRLAVDGEPLHVAQALHALERFFEILRGQIDESAPLQVDAMEGIVGRYASLALHGGRRHWLYYERAGNPDGPPLLMLHTAGADSRQYHALMSDPQLQAEWDMIAFDMPAHGRSMPHASDLWQGYQLDKENYASVCDSFIREVVKRPAVLMGCSMGAALALYLGARRPAQVAGLIALEAPYRAQGRRTNHLAHPAVNQAAHNPSYVRGLMSPLSPLSQRRAAAWIYSQGGFQVYSGDLFFYSEQFDAAVDLQGLDGTRKPVYLLTGAYDYSATPADSRRAASHIPGARFVEMPELGHFPMIENPHALLQHLRPVLQAVREQVIEEGDSHGKQPHHAT